MRHIINFFCIIVLLVITGITMISCDAGSASLRINPPYLASLGIESLPNDANDIFDYIEDLTFITEEQIEELLSISEIFMNSHHYFLHSRIQNPVSYGHLNFTMAILIEHGWITPYELADMGISDLRGSVPGASNHNTVRTSSNNISFDFRYTSSAELESSYNENESVVGTGRKAFFLFRRDSGSAVISYHGTAMSYAIAFRNNEFYGRAVINAGFAYSAKDREDEYSPLLREYTSTTAYFIIDIYDKENDVRAFRWSMSREDALTFFGFE